MELFDASRERDSALDLERPRDYSETDRLTIVCKFHCMRTRAMQYFASLRRSVQDR